jgi:hypothetical protein
MCQHSSAKECRSGSPYFVSFILQFHIQDCKRFYKCSAEHAQLTFQVILPPRIGGTKLCYSAGWLMQDAWREDSFLAFRSLLLRGAQSAFPEHKTSKWNDWKGNEKAWDRMGCDML